jgi:hypothetical protein
MAGSFLFRIGNVVVIARYPGPNCKKKITFAILILQLLKTNNQL